jgi:hypothetical protein
MSGTLSVAGFASCPFHKRAVEAAKKLETSGLVASLDDRTFASRDEYREWLFSSAGSSSFSEPAAQRHTSSPFVWMNESDDRTFVGGCDATLELAATLEAAQQDDLVIAAAPRPEVVASINNFWGKYVSHS